MRSFRWTALALAVRARAQSNSYSITQSPQPWLPITTVTVTSTTSVSTATVTTTSTFTSTSTVTVPAGDGSAATSTISSDPSIVTDQAYIDTVLRHHNYHRQNHSSPTLVWDAGLADIARQITTQCVFDLDLTINCPDSDCYGQSAAAGYPATEMGGLISEGFYNPEANAYTYYGHEPDVNTYSSWGYLTQIVWKATTQVGCYTADCSANGLDFPDNDGDGVPPYFTICNYKIPGNYYGNFTEDVLPPIGLPTILGGYECRNYNNCVNAVAGNGDEHAGGDDGDDSGEEDDGVIASPKKKRKVKRRTGKKSWSPKEWY